MRKSLLNILLLTWFELLICTLNAQEVIFVSPPIDTPKIKSLFFPKYSISDSTLYFDIKDFVNNCADDFFNIWTISMDNYGNSLLIIGENTSNMPDNHDYGFLEIDKKICFLSGEEMNTFFTKENDSTLFNSIIEPTIIIDPQKTHILRVYNKRLDWNSDKIVLGNAFIDIYKQTLNLSIANLSPDTIKIYNSLLNPTIKNLFSVDGPFDLQSIRQGYIIPFVPVIVENTAITLMLYSRYKYLNFNYKPSTWSFTTMPPNSRSLVTIQMDSLTCDFLCFISRNRYYSFNNFDKNNKKMSNFDLVDYYTLIIELAIYSDISPGKYSPYVMNNNTYDYFVQKQNIIKIPLIVR